MLIALSAPIGSGKSTLANAIKEKYGDKIEILKFAEPLYQIQHFCYSIFGIEKLEPKRDRELLRMIGMYFREKYSTILTETFKRNYLKFSNEKIVICDDLRFNDEAELIHELNGKIIRIDASFSDFHITDNQHISENGIDPNLIDEKIYNEGTLDELVSIFECILSNN